MIEKKLCLIVLIFIIFSISTKSGLAPSRFRRYFPVQGYYRYPYTYSYAHNPQNKVKRVVNGPNSMENTNALRYTAEYPSCNGDAIMNVKLSTIDRRLTPRSINLNTIKSTEDKDINHHLKRQTSPEVTTSERSNKNSENNKRQDSYANMGYVMVYDKWKDLLNHIRGMEAYPLVLGTMASFNERAGLIPKCYATLKTSTKLMSTKLTSEAETETETETVAAKTKETKMTTTTTLTTTTRATTKTKGTTTTTAPTTPTATKHVHPETYVTISMSESEESFDTEEEGIYFTANPKAASKSKPATDSGTTKRSKTTEFDIWNEITKSWSKNRIILSEVFKETTGIIESDDSTVTDEVYLEQDLPPKTTAKPGSCNEKNSKNEMQKKWQTIPDWYKKHPHNIEVDVTQADDL